MKKQKIEKLVTAVILTASTILPLTAAGQMQVQASTINDMAKGDSYGGVTDLQQLLYQEGIKYNSFASNKIPYRNGAPEGVVIHETATPNATAHNEAIYFNREWMNMYAYVHAFVDKTGVIQMTSPDYGVWGAGPQANNRFIQVELCEENNQADFARGVNNDAIYVAGLLHKYNLVPSNAAVNGQGTIWSHHAVSRFLGGTDHTDPDGYFAKWGYSMADFCALVKYYYGSQNSSGLPIPAAPAPTPVKPVTPAKPVKPTLPAPVAAKTLIHNAIIYDENGKAAAKAKKAGSKLTIYGSKVINGRKYLQVGLDQYVVASNVEGKLRFLKHNAYFYNNGGYRIGYGKLYRNNYVRVYGGRVKINGRKYYQINVDEFIKISNFK